MAEPKLDKTWLSPILERDLGQVSAPDELWCRLRQPRISRTRKPGVWMPLAVLASATVMAAVVWGLLPPRETPSAQMLAVRALTRAPETLELQSGTLSEIRAWIRTRTGLELPLPSETSRSVRVTGVCAVKGGVPTIEVAYRVSGHKAALLVSKAGMAVPGDGKHRFLKCESTAGTRVSSWIMRGQLYTLAYSYPGDLNEECLLCHRVAGPSTLVN